MTEEEWTSIRITKKELNALHRLKADMVKMTREDMRLGEAIVEITDLLDTVPINKLKKDFDEQFINTVAELVLRKIMERMKENNKKCGDN